MNQTTPNQINNALTPTLAVALQPWVHIVGPQNTLLTLPHNSYPYGIIARKVRS